MTAWLTQDGSARDLPPYDTYNNTIHIPLDPLVRKFILDQKPVVIYDKPDTRGKDLTHRIIAEILYQRGIQADAINLTANRPLEIWGFRYRSIRGSLVTVEYNPTDAMKIEQYCKI